MNSYPIELLTQLAPVMFVAGLDAPRQPPTSPATPTHDPFAALVLRLREALIAQRKSAIWQLEKSKSFYTILVDKEVRFPPRKLIPQDDPQHAAAHSPLSPLTSSSPLYPDGLIAPIWVRKHTTLIPSVFVLFMRIFEHPPHNPKSPLDTPDAEYERDRDYEERKMDTQLSHDIAARKKTTNERGIKLTVVLIASRKMLDDPSLDGRLTYIRKTSGLDSRAALFVLSPVNQAELGDFVRSLQSALYDPAVEYYTNHSKRVRRKRNRHSQTVSSYPNPLIPPGGVAAARPLRPEGWTVRYEYKMACFAEFRGENEVALKHYQDAYEMLVIMFGSTASLPPRTKRWAEAKVLVDCINVKIVKLYLYNDEHTLALSHHNTHIRKFGDFSRGWSIGEDTFEFWSWIARQHRVLAELLEQGIRAGFSIPIHVPSNAIQSANTATAGALGQTSPIEQEAFRSLGLNPTHALQHPGFYYYMAARCTEMRRDRFATTLEAERNGAPVSQSPGFANEKKVDHIVIIQELYTKAYELFKKYASSNADNQNQNPGRHTLWIAFRIAQTYFDSGAFDMAVKFFERIAKTYRREKWGSMLRPLLTTWYACAQQLGDVELSIRLLIEMMGHGLDEVDEPSALEEDLLAVLKSTVPSSPDEALIIDLSESEPIFDTNVVFWASEVKVGELAAFQLWLTSPPDVSISLLPFVSLEIQFSDTLGPLIITHDDSELNTSPIQRIILGNITATHTPANLTTCLRWIPGQSLIFTGTICLNLPATIQISRLVLTLADAAWRIEIPCDPCRHRGTAALAPRWLASLEPIRFIPINKDESSIVRIRHRHHKVIADISQHSPAYLDETYTLSLNVENDDDRELELTLDILLQPSDVDVLNTIIVDDESSSSLIKGVSLGVVAPGVSVTKSILLKSTGAAGDRILDISIQSRNVQDANADDEELRDVFETLKTVVVSTVDPFHVDYDVVYRRSLEKRVGLADMRTFDADFWEGDGEAVVSARVECMGPWNLEVVQVVLHKETNAKARIIDSSMDEADQEPVEYFPGDEFGEVCRISLAPFGHKEDFVRNPIVGPGEYQIQWKRILPSGERGSSTTTTLLLPSLRPPQDLLIALLSVSPTMKLHEPAVLTLIIRNHHISRAATIIVQHEPDPGGDAFVVAGPRQVQLPILLSGGEETVRWQLVPLECGYVSLPRIRVLDRRKTNGLQEDVEVLDEVVKIVDMRLEHRLDATVRALEGGADADGKGSEEVREQLGRVLVLP